MKVVVLGGAGAMGQITVRDLVESTAVTQVTIADMSKERADQLKNRLGAAKVTTTAANIEDRAGLVSILKGHEVLINCAPYKLNTTVMECALEAGCHYLDLGGLFHVTRQQLELHNKFKSANLLAVLGMGAAPGITNVMAAHAANDLHTVDSIDIYCAGVDFTETNHPFLPPYSLETIIDEYALEPMVFENGRFLAKPPCSGEVSLDLPQPVGRVSAFLTLHSEIATLPLTYQAKGIRNCTYRLGLPAQFHERMKFLVDLGFGSTGALNIDGASVKPRRFLQKLLDQHPTPEGDPHDCEVIRVDVTGTRNGRPALIRMETTIHSSDQWKASSGALDTGVPPSIVAQMIGLGMIKERGVLAPEACVPAQLFFVELAKRSIVMRRLSEENLVEDGSAKLTNPRISGTGIPARTP